MRTDGEVVAATRRLMDRHWQPEGFTVPNNEVYPHQWLWDSCFHAVIWVEIGQAERAVIELRSLFAHQSDSGFVPHMTYWREPDLHAAFWGRPGVSTLTQPPMYGHALAALARSGTMPPTDLVRSALAGMHHLAERRSETDGSGLVAVLHPWETGCDDSPRWDSWCPGGFDRTRWRKRKGELVAALELDAAGEEARRSEAFTVGSIGFNALVGFNAVELASVVPEGDDRDWLLALATDLRASLGARWDDELGCEHDWASPYRRSCGVRTLDSMLGVLLEDRPDSRVARAQLSAMAGDGAFGGACGPASVHRSEPAFDPAGYWRGAAWPLLTYLCWVAARRLGADDRADDFASMLLAGARRSGLSECWHPDTGQALGASPQTWAGLAAVVDGDGPQVA